MSDDSSRQLTNKKRRLRRNKIIISLSSFVLIVACILLTFSTQYKRITVEVDGEKYSIGTFSKTYEEVLKNQDIHVNTYDETSIDLKSNIKNKANLVIERALPASISFDGKSITIYSTDKTVGQLLNNNKITLRENDFVTPLLDEKITSNMEIKITRVDKKIETRNEEIAFKIQEKEDNSITVGKEQVAQEGVKGKKEIKTEVTLENGVEVSREVVSDKVVLEPVNKVIAIGTKPIEVPKPETAVKASSNIEIVESVETKPQVETQPVATAAAPSGNVLVCTATAYSPYDGGSYYDITASGAVATRDPNGYSTIAVDPTVIPLGTKVYVKGYGYAIAQDTGGLIKGHKIDVFFNTPQECFNWGVKTVEVTILN